MVEGRGRKIKAVWSDVPAMEGERESEVEVARDEG